MIAAELMFLTMGDPVTTQELKNPHPLVFIISLPKADVSVSQGPSNKSTFLTPTVTFLPNCSMILEHQISQV